MKSDVLRHGKVNLEILKLSCIQLKHIFIEMMIVEAKFALRLNIRVEFALPLPELQVLFMSYLLSFGQFLLSYHLLKLFLLFSFSLLHLFECILMFYFCLLLPFLLQLKQLLFRVVGVFPNRSIVSVLLVLLK